MLSIIVCSRKKQMLDAFVINVEDTIGIPYEIIPIDNSANHYSISEAYNIGAQQASYDELLFVHEDVKFLTQSWGENALRHLHSDSEIGVIGLAGSTFKTRSISSWWQPELDGYEPKRMNIIQVSPDNTGHYKHLMYNPFQEAKSEVASLDGVFLLVKKGVWSSNPFDEKRLKGFHGYDLDFSLSIGKKYKNYVVYDILLEHLSEGQNNESWVDESIAVHKKHINSLPRRTNADKININYIDKENNLRVIDMILNAKSNKLRRLLTLFRSGIFGAEKIFYYKYIINKYL